MSFLFWKDFKSKYLQDDILDGLTEVFLPQRPVPSPQGFVRVVRPPWLVQFQLLQTGGMHRSLQLLHLKTPTPFIQYIFTCLYDELHEDLVLYNNGQQCLYLHSLRTAKGTIMFSKNGQICTVVFFSPFFNDKMIKVFRPYLCIDSIIYRSFFCFLNICAASNSCFNRIA